MNQKGMSLIETTIALAFVGGLGLVTTTLLTNMQRENTNLILTNEMINLRNSFTQMYSRPGLCLEEMRPVIDASSFKSSLASIKGSDYLTGIATINTALTTELAKPLIVPVALQGKGINGKAKGIQIGQGFGEVKLENLEIVSALNTPRVPFKVIEKAVGDKMKTTSYRAFIKATLKHNNVTKSFLLLPLNFHFDASGELADCSVGTTVANNTVETCVNVLNENPASFYVRYVDEQCYLISKSTGVKVQINGSTPSESFFCQIEKNIQKLRPADTTLVPKVCTSI